LREIYLIRHTTPEVEKGVCYGQTDLNLKNTFPQEAKRIKEILPEKFDVIYTSPLKRCFQLAKYISEENLVIDNSLLEINFGKWEMKKYTELTNNEFNDWCTDFINKIPPEGESYKQMYDRVVEGWKNIINRNDKLICIVTHSGVIRIIFSYILNIDLKDSFKIAQNYGAVNKIIIDKEIITIEYTNR
jgi:alpha-ribazole phosphatase